MTNCARVRNANCGGRVDRPGFVDQCRSAMHDRGCVKSSDVLDVGCLLYLKGSQFGIYVGGRVFWVLAGFTGGTGGVVDSPANRHMWHGHVARSKSIEVIVP